MRAVPTPTSSDEQGSGETRQGQRGAGPHTQAPAGQGRGPFGAVWPNTSPERDPEVTPLWGGLVCASFALGSRRANHQRLLCGPRNSDPSHQQPADSSQAWPRNGTGGAWSSHGSPSTFSCADGLPSARRKPAGERKLVGALKGQPASLAGAWSCTWELAPPRAHAACGQQVLLLPSPSPRPALSASSPGVWPRKVGQRQKQSHRRGRRAGCAGGDSAGRRSQGLSPSKGLLREPGGQASSPPALGSLPGAPLRALTGLHAQPVCLTPSSVCRSQPSGEPWVLECLTEGTLGGRAWRARALPPGPTAPGGLWDHRCPRARLGAPAPEAQGPR